MLDILVTIPANEEHMNKLAKAARNAHDVRFTVKIRMILSLKTWTARM